MEFIIGTLSGLTRFYRFQGIILSDQGELHRRAGDLLGGLRKSG